MAPNFAIHKVLNGKIPTQYILYDSYAFRLFGILFIIVASLKPGCPEMCWMSAQKLLF